MSANTPTIQHIGQTHRVIHWPQLYAAIQWLQQNMAVIFQIMPDLQHCRVLEQWLQKFHGVIERDLLRCGGGCGIKIQATLSIAANRRTAMTQRHIAGLARHQRHRDTDKIGSRRIQRAGFGINSQIALLAGCCDPFFQRFGVSDQLIFRCSDIIQHRYVRGRYCRLGCRCIHV